MGQYTLGPPSWEPAWQERTWKLRQHHIKCEPVMFLYYKGTDGIQGHISFQWCPVTGPEAMGTNQNTRGPF